MAGDLSGVSKNGYLSAEKGAKLWADLFNQHVAAQGLPESYVAYIEKMVKAVAFYRDAYNGKRWQLVRARICEAEAAELMSGEGEKIETTCARISKFVGFPVLAHKCSVTEFYSYIETMATK